MKVKDLKKGNVIFWNNGVCSRGRALYYNIVDEIKSFNINPNSDKLFRNKLPIFVEYKKINGLRRGRTMKNGERAEGYMVVKWVPVRVYQQIESLEKLDLETELREVFTCKISNI